MEVVWAGDGGGLHWCWQCRHGGVDSVLVCWMQDIFGSRVLALSLPTGSKLVCSFAPGLLAVTEPVVIW